MDNYWSIGTREEVKTPYNYVEQQCNYLNKITGGKVIARIETYEGKYKSEYSRILNVGSFFGEQYDVQDDLGDKDNKFVYQFYLTSEFAPKYKYRIMFMAYGVSLYPLEISLEKSIADEIGSMNTEMVIDTEEEFLELLKSILKTEKVVGVVNNLLAIENV